LEDEKLKPLLITWRNNERDKKIAKYIRNKSCFAAWTKDAMFEKMEREEKEQNQQNAKPIPPMGFGVQFKEDIM
jgi:hypothetical protein